MKYIFSLGSNMGNREENLNRALAAFNTVSDTKVTAVSSVYVTAPIGYADQQDFFNIAVVVDSALSPVEMIGVCKGIEAAMGRIRTIRNGPRPIDIDIILAESGKTDTPTLTVPHPRWRERRFVMLPMKELFGDCVVFGEDFKDDLKKSENQRVEKLKTRNS